MALASALEALALASALVVLALALALASVASGSKVKGEGCAKMAQPFLWISRPSGLLALTTFWLFVHQLVDE
ncbi:hypothetical protein PAENIP36_66600 [Paenibacillus sp. P36]